MLDVTHQMYKAALKIRFRVAVTVPNKTSWLSTCHGIALKYVAKFKLHRGLLELLDAIYK